MSKKEAHKLQKIVDEFNKRQQAKKLSWKQLKALLG